MRTIRQDILAAHPLSGVWCNLGCPPAAEIAARTGFDWVLIDNEHGSGDHAAMQQQIQAVKHYACAPIVRIAANEPHLFKLALDAGAAGVMVPQVCSADDAERAVAAMRYPPYGMRGVSKFNAATCYGMGFDHYRNHTAHELTTIIQIETAEALASVEDIAGIDGVDVLFVGPMDLSYALNTPADCTHPQFTEAIERIAIAARAAGKAAGILLASGDQVHVRRSQGFSFLALGSDAHMVVQGMSASLEALETHHAPRVRRPRDAAHVRGT